MRYQYVVILKKKSERASDAFSILFCLFSVIFFMFSALRTHGWLPAGLAFLLIIGISYNVIARRKGRSGVRYRYWLLIAAIGWIGTTPTPWVGAFFFILAFLEYQTKRPLEIGFDHDHIVMNTLIKRHFIWSMFNNIVLKDGLLTLDFKDNRLVQREIADDEDEDDADEEEFNAYCRERLNA